MTPDAVIYRYLQLCDRRNIDAQRLCELLGADADLLSHWLTVLALPVQSELLHEHILNMDSDALSDLAQAQGWATMPVAGGARLGLDQWMGVLQAAYLAEELATLTLPQSDLDDPSEHHDLSPLDVRMRTLLALSGVQLSHDPQLKQMIDYRGMRAELLEDAALDLRIFAVADVHDSGQAAEYAELLLDVDRSEFDMLARSANAAVDALMVRLDIDANPDVDWPHKLWLRQQLALVTTLMADANTWREFEVNHALISRSIFDSTPIVLRLAPEDSHLRGPGVDIKRLSKTSRIAASVRNQAVATMSDGSDLAVVDRQVLRMLDSEEAVVMPVGGENTFAVLIAPHEDDRSVVAAEIYAELIESHVDRLLHPQESTDLAEGVTEDETVAEPDMPLTLFRDQESQRLREIVHEANNPLSIVHNYLHILELRLAHDEAAKEQLQLIGSELKRAANIFSAAREVPSQTALVSEVPQQEVSTFDMFAFVDNVAEIHRGYAQEHGVKIEAQSLGAELLMNTSQDKLAQILGNLVKNAIEACAVGDLVQIGAHDGVYRGGRVGVELFVSDTGPGLPADVLQNLTLAKQSAKGGDHQGIGLQMAFRLAAELDGALDVRTSSAAGTTFSLFLAQGEQIAGPDEKDARDEQDEQEPGPV